ncbi:putative DnaJ/Hsp40 [Cafeteria roenbergensis virus]|uniref:Putative DnaJ/Hsp40 n=1 Tax=Cafeteria roenbergensis virus (strain BV-PW1) TaxID=693272 RepID=E3T5E6_CROVB|nr:putative DnaJ/Hsp40 [Cafeteria roenbergensis virus BV-PW1]ADO67409.1 putative DnaJ/Hsp40 [Cafeteria roenbergensis virus BV-PW1]
MNLYNILGISKNSNINEIRKAYHQMLLKYHPDKNNSLEAKEKLEEVKVAYEILSNSDTRKKYSMLNQDKTDKLWWILQGWIRNISSSDLSSLLDKKIYENLDEFFNIFENLTLEDIISWFYKPTKLPSHNLDNYTESETNTWSNDNCLKLYKIPLKYLTDKNTNIKIILNSNLIDIIQGNSKKIKINRKINDINKLHNFIVPLNYSYIIFPNAGDIINNQVGDLIFINLLEGWNWEENNLVLEKSITLYQMLYGLDINLNLQDNKITYNNYIPHRDGWELFLQEKNNVKFKIRFILEELNEDKQELLYTYFN